MRYRYKAYKFFLEKDDGTGFIFSFKRMKIALRESKRLLKTRNEVWYVRSKKTLDPD